ncbi:MAG: hypothetical protein E6J90_33710 [Deltaproteobacteria bacterium]|nr:MAG: hypothetical protein E6J91_27065 [Deltaproteobacteria bacterium]TMQ11745.1 MAG: hypothetical protein E6J90_33710 [Deltaproteobacteria bacterium]
MRSLIVPALSVTLIACGADGNTHVGGACKADRSCDSGQICDQTDPGGPVCLDVNGDADGDGIPNGKDFCEHMAGGAFDEDGDGIGDECDLCPIAKPQKPADADGDMVDAPCDPDPRKAGEKIVLFNGFNTTPANLPSGWTVQGGEVIYTPTDPNAVSQLSFALAVPSNHMSIQVGYRIDSVAAGATEADVGVISSITIPMNPQPVQCVGSRKGPLDQLVLMTDATETTQEMMNLFNPASLYRLGEQLDGTTASCALISDKETGAKQGPSSGFAMDHVALSARGATVRFSYLLVTQH